MLNQHRSPNQGFDHCYAGSCYRAGIPARHHRTSVATDRPDRTLDNRSGHAAGSRAGFPAFVRRLLSPSPDPSAPACADKNAATPHLCEPHAPPLRTTENVAADSLVCSNRPIAAGLRWSVRWESVPHSWLPLFHPRIASAHPKRFPSPEPYSVRRPDESSAAVPEGAARPTLLPFGLSRRSVARAADTAIAMRSAVRLYSE